MEGGNESITTASWLQELKGKFALNFLSFIGEGRNYNNITVFDNNVYPDEDPRAHEVRTLCFAIELEELEELGEHIMALVKEIKTRNK